jgi:isoleucyl-tRNA synthetase
VAALDTVLTDELKLEGLAREIVSRVQRLRRDAGYEMADRIQLWVDGGPQVREAAAVHRGYISEETLAVSLDAGAADGADMSQETDLDGVTARIAVKRVSTGS